MPVPSYDRAPSEELRQLLMPGRFLAPLVELNRQKVGDYEHDVHFRRNDEIHVYRGRTSLLKIAIADYWSVEVTAEDHKYKRQACAKPHFRPWNIGELRFSKALKDYLCDVKVNPTFTMGEGAIQSQWSKVTEPWIPFDREVQLGYASTGFSQVEAARTELTKHLGAAQKSGVPRKLDQLAVDSCGDLVLIELKDAAKQSANPDYATFQLLHYVWSWHHALDAVRGSVQALINARVAVGLTPPDVPQLTGSIRAAVGFGSEAPNTQAGRYGMVLDIVNEHLPPDIGPIETWEYADTGPRQVA